MAKYSKVATQKVKEEHASPMLIKQQVKDHQLHPLRLPQSKIYYIAVGRRKFVFDCGVIGFCPPCTRATPLAGVGSLLVGGWRREPCTIRTVQLKSK